MQQSSPDEEGNERPGARPDLLAAMRDQLQGGSREAVRAIADSLKAPDLADLMELLEPAERVHLINLLGDAFDPEVFSELDPSVRDQLSEDLPNDVLVAGGHVDPAVIQKLKDVFRDPEIAPKLKAALLQGTDSYKLSAFLPDIEDSDYEMIRQGYITIGQPQFAKPLE